MFCAVQVQRVEIREGRLFWPGQWWKRRKRIKKY